MKKMLSFIPLAVGISAALIYIFNVLQFKVAGNNVTILQAASTLKIYLYIVIISFIIYFIIKIIMLILYRKTNKFINIQDNSYEPFENINNKEHVNTYTPNYDYVPIYNNTINEVNKEEVIVEVKKCFNCKKQIQENDKYCSYCGANQNEKKKVLSPFVKNIINILEIVILILVIYFLLNMLFDFKEKQDPNFKSPFKVSMTK